MTVPTISTEMVGRDADLAELRRAFDRAGGGQPSAVLVEGEAGIGKSRLLREFPGEVAGAADIHIGRCFDLGSARSAYGPLTSILRSMVERLGLAEAKAAVGVGAEALRMLVPELGEGVAERERTSPDALHDAVAALIEAAADTAPQVIVVEDLHWVDDSTLVMLTYLLRTLQEGRVLLLITCRSDDVRRGDAVSRFIAETTRARILERLALERLDRDATRQLVSQLHDGDLSETSLDRLMDRAEGVPFFIEEVSCCASGPLPESLRDMLLVRFDQLDDDGRHIVRVMSGTDGLLPHTMLTRLAGLPDDRLDAAIRAASHLGILSVHDDEYTFRHNLLREAVHDDLLPGERARLHRAYAEALEAKATAIDSCDLSSLAHHWHLAQVPDRALVASVGAMQEAKSRFAFASAARFGELALELWEQVPDAETIAGLSHVRLMRHIGSILRNAGEAERALVVAERALAEVGESTDPADHARLLRDRGFFLSNLGLPGAMELFLEALEIVDRAVDDDQLHATLLNGLAGKYMLASMLPEAIITATQALEIASRIDDPREISVAHNLRGTCRTYLGQLDEAFADFREAARFAPRSSGGPELRYHVNYSDMLALLGRHREASRVAEAGIERARELGVERASGRAMVQNMVEPLLTLGDIDEATSRLAAVPIGRPQVLNDQYVVLTRLRVLAWQGKVDEVECMREEWMPALHRAAELERQAWYRIVENEIALDVAHGHWVDALNTIVAMTQDEGFVLLHAYRLLLESGWVVAEVRASGDDVDAAVAAIRALWGEIPATVRDDDWAAMLDALLDPSIPALRVAVTLANGDDVPAVMRGITRLELARQLVADGQRSEAQTVLADAAATAATIGHVPLQNSIAAFGRASGLVSQAGAADALELTARERQVVDLVAEGLSNKQIGERLFISAKTASVHVSAILRKLGVATRTEAAMVVARR
ncbi:ATP-binding protein [Microbacterium sp.]|uniref:ATP-binding protein n=1 Tax=Microbacterium sp. TaxID=51671 RepID=UPI003F9D05E4